MFPYGNLTQLAALKAAAGFSPQSGSPGGGLTATYRTPYEEPCAYELSAFEGVFLNSVFSYGFWP